MTAAPRFDGSPVAPAPSAPVDAVLAAVADRLGEAVMVVGADRRIRLVNGAARTLIGLERDCEGTRLEDAVGDYRLALMVAACIASGEEVDRELSDHEQGRHVLARAIPVGGGPGVSPQVVIVLRDESELRRLETVRRDFVANVSHELRTPIAAIQLLVETLQGGALGDIEVAAEFVDKIGLEVSHMSQMVSELLELSTIESGRRAVRTVPVAVETLVEAADRLRPLADERHLRLEHDLDPGTPPVAGDPQALAQVVRNLVHNAIKFTPPGGHITIGARPCPRREGYVELRVADTGVGIPELERARIFERFYKADKSRQRDGEGTGLGLAIARHTVEAHGGSIAVESEAGVGSVFLVELPAALRDATGARIGAPG